VRLLRLRPARIWTAFSIAHDLERGHRGACLALALRPKVRYSGLQEYLEISDLLTETETEC